MLELGGGSGGITQRLLKTDSVDQVTTLVYGLYEKGSSTRHNRFRVFDSPQMGKFKNKHTLLVGDIHGDTVKTEDRKSDISLLDRMHTGEGGVTCLISDIGESKPNTRDQMEYSKKKRERFLQLYYAQGKPLVIVYKELCPWDPFCENFCRKLDLGVVRQFGATHGRSEVYAVRNLDGPVGKSVVEGVAEIGNRLLSHMENTTLPKIQTVKPRRNMVLDHEYRYVEPELKRPYKLPDIDQTEVLKSVEEQKGTLRDPRNSYRSVKELHVINNVGDSASGQHFNSILRKILYPIHCITSFMTTWGLTDTSAGGTFGVYDKKVDTCPVENHDYRLLEEKFFKRMVSGMRMRLEGDKNFPMLSYEEAVQRLRSKAAIGMKLAEEFDWATDPRIKEQVLQELDNMKSGKPTMAMVLTMGKREKKKRRKGLFTDFQYEEQVTHSQLWL